MDEARAQSIGPLAWGGNTGQHMAATDLVAPLAEAPERPRCRPCRRRSARAMASPRVLQRAGVSAGRGRTRPRSWSRARSPLGDDHARHAASISRSAAARTRPSPARSRALNFRARFDLKLCRLARAGNGSSTLARHADRDRQYAAARSKGWSGSSLYRSARAAGAPANGGRSTPSSRRSRSTHLRIGRDIGAADTHFDAIIEHARAETGEVKIGSLLFAGITQGRQKAPAGQMGQ